MNANELADVLEDDYWDSRANKVMLEGAKMLRQQQAEIEALKQIIDANNLNQNIGQFVKPTNEPVAWMRLTGNRVTRITLEKVQDSDIPLYTHPVKLTDEEIIACIDESEPDTADMIRFARAILRKAKKK